LGADEDRILVEEVLSGKVRAFETLIRTYQKTVFFTALRLLRKNEDADEVTQQTFFKAHTHLSKFRFESSLKTWLITIALNLARNHLRSRRRETVLIDEQWAEQWADPKGEDFVSMTDEEGRRQWMRSSLEGLPPTQKEVVVLRIQEELPFKEIGRILEMSEGTAKVNFHHGMKRLKEGYEKLQKRERQ